MANTERPSPARQGYDRHWQKARRQFLKQHPLCTECQRQGRVVTAEVVDHITPHQGDPELFWDRNNWQALCNSCHSSWKQAQEKQGQVTGVDEDGIPLDPNHPWRA